MTNKLTAKLSDGREFEVCSTWHAKEDNYTMIVCRPQEKQAREWWAVRDPNLCQFVMFDDKQSAEIHAEMNNLKPPILVREVRKPV